MSEPRTDIKTGRFYWEDRACGAASEANGYCRHHQDQARLELELSKEATGAYSKNLMQINLEPHLKPDGTAKSRFAKVFASLKFPELPPKCVGTELTMSREEFAVIVEALRMCSAIEWMRGIEGDSVMILCDNPDPEDRQENNAVLCNGDWTSYEDARFTGSTLLEALEKSAAERARKEAL